MKKKKGLFYVGGGGLGRSPAQGVRIHGLELREWCVAPRMAAITDDDELYLNRVAEGGGVGLVWRDRWGGFTSPSHIALCFGNCVPKPCRIQPRHPVVWRGVVPQGRSGKHGRRRLLCPSEILARGA